MSLSHRWQPGRCDVIITDAAPRLINGVQHVEMVIENYQGKRMLVLVRHSDLYESVGYISRPATAQYLPPRDTRGAVTIAANGAVLFSIKTQLPDGTIITPPTQQVPINTAAPPQYNSRLNPYYRAAVNKTRQAAAAKAAAAQQAAPPKVTHPIQNSAAWQKFLDQMLGVSNSMGAASAAINNAAAQTAAYGRTIVDNPLDVDEKEVRHSVSDAELKQLRAAWHVLTTLVARACSDEEMGDDAPEYLEIDEKELQTLGSLELEIKHTGSHTIRVSVKSRT